MRHPTASHRPGRQALPARAIEPLEPRRLFNGGGGYGVTDLTPLIPGGAPQGVEAYRINDNGTVALQAVGGTSANNFADGRSYLYSIRRHRAYALPKGFVPRALNDRDQAVDSAGVDTNGQIQSIPDVPGYNSGFLATDVNDQGVVVGLMLKFYTGQTPVPGVETATPALFDPATGQTTLVSSTDFPEAPVGGLKPSINDAGLVAYDVRSSGTEHAAVFNTKTGQLTDIGARFPSGTSSYAIDVNNNGQVVGTVSGKHPVAFLYDTRDDTVTMIPAAPGDADPQPTAINDDGLIVGTVDVRVRTRHGFHYVTRAGIVVDGEMVDLNTLAHAPGGATLTKAVDVNDAGQILAVDTPPTSLGGHAYVMSAPTSPTTAAAIAPSAHHRRHDLLDK